MEILNQENVREGLEDVKDTLDSLDTGEPLNNPVLKWTDEGMMEEIFVKGSPVLGFFPGHSRYYHAVLENTVEDSRTLFATEWTPVNSEMEHELLALDSVDLSGNDYVVASFRYTGHGHHWDSQTGTKERKVWNHEELRQNTQYMASGLTSLISENTTVKDRGVHFYLVRNKIPEDLVNEYQETIGQTEKAKLPSRQ